MKRRYTLRDRAETVVRRIGNNLFLHPIGEREDRLMVQYILDELRAVSKLRRKR